ncbi:hypothetical protein TIFTF001_052329 [Ficus carica]|uniref:Protein SIEVE ELEMENT OCCLUSION B-like n=1 Tax=Ficus carica TaxID=3494 RepID=A0AA88EG83_FICCA|nr:hypothetical protein TIFTF001_052326 [Ficus carica]GMN74184.1 hypothetical protein TIFTF001_052327 [Ficus carica]GMN74190.1 hypothetical protein TIFTF001_052328 [Ficus carica]GMN74194.1 hypothetical protein TIFTF001_052329 [Ficus carica]
MEFGDFWLLAHHQQSDQLAKSLATLKRVSVLVKPAEIQKRRQEVLELNNLIKTTMQVIAIFDEFEKLSLNYNLKDVPGLTIALDLLPVPSTGPSLVSLLALLRSVPSQGEGVRSSTVCAESSLHLQQAKNPANFLQEADRKINFHFDITEEAESYRRLRKIFQTPTEIMEVFKALIFTKDNVQPLIDGSTNKTVQIEVIRKRYVLLYITGLDISDDDISVLKPVYDATKKDDRYKIVWVPIVEQWTEEQRKKFEILRVKMPWYVVQYYSPIAGLKFVKEEWEYKGKPTLVVVNPQGKVENVNALHLIRVWGMKAFPFNKAAEEAISREREWIGPVVNNFHPSVQTWIKEEKYILFYGGKDNEWIQQFSKKATALANDPIIKDTLKTNIELFCIGKTAKGGEDHGLLGRFWTSIESLFFTKVHHQQVDPVTQEIQKLLSYKNESGWAVLSKGQTVVVAGHGFTILKVVEEFDKWKEAVKEYGFEYVFKEYHNKVIQSVRHCCRLDIPSVSAKVPETMQCPECPRIMETFITYKCCHIDAPANAHH